MIKKIKFALILMAFSTLIFSCGEENNEKKDNSSNDKKVESTENQEEAIEELPAVCVWSKLSVRETPAAKGKYKTAIYLGEKVTFKGETVKDTASKKGVEYIKIELADGSIGWADKRFIAVNASSFVFVNDSKLYSRPDILTATSKKFEKMQFVAVSETKDTWSKIKGVAKGGKWFSEGWVKTSNLTDSEVDVSVAILMSRALSLQDSEKKISALKEIIDNTDLKSTIFTNVISEKITELSTPSEVVDEVIGD